MALDPIDGTSNLANGLPNSISVMAASQQHPGGPLAMHTILAFYSMKLAYGPQVAAAIAAGLPEIELDDPPEMTLHRLAEALGKHVQELVVVMLNRARQAPLIAEVRRIGAALRMISDGDITAAVAPRCRTQALTCTTAWEAARGSADRRGPQGPRRRDPAPHVATRRGGARHCFKRWGKPNCAAFSAWPNSCRAKAPCSAQPASATARSCPVSKSPAIKPSRTPCSCEP